MSGPARTWIGSMAGRLVGFAVVWWALSEGDTGMWTYGAVIVPAVTAASMYLVRPSPQRVRLARRATGIVQLAVWFAWNAFLGGVDVARRAVRRPVDITPGVVVYRIAMSSVPGRVLMADLNSLMPGMLSVDLDGDLLRVHVLDVSQPVHAQLAELERRVTRVVGR